MDNEMNFQINQTVDEIINEKFPPVNFGDVTLNWMSQNLRSRFYSLIEKSATKVANANESSTSLKINSSPMKSFIEGIKSEYGIDKELNLTLSYQHYRYAADLNEPGALYKLYLISRNESSKFQVERNKTMEMYHLFKAVAFLNGGVFFGNDIMYSIDIIYETALHLDLEDLTLEKTNQLFLNLKNKVNDEELRFVEAMTLIKFHMNDDDIINGVTILTDLADNLNYIEAKYKLACIYSRSVENVISKDTLLAERYFEACDKENYVKCYDEYGLFLYKKGDSFKAREILFKGIHLETDYKQLEDLLELLVDDIITGNVFSLFEFFFTRRILKKRFKLKENEAHGIIERELVDILQSAYTNREALRHSFLKGVVDTEFMLSYGYILYSDVNTVDHIKSAELLKCSLKSSTNQSYKRFCYSFLFKIRSRMFVSQSEDKDTHLITEEKLNKTKRKLFEIYFNSLENGNLEDFSSSFYYYIGKIYEMGWGIKQDDLRAYCHFAYAAKASLKYLGTGSIISYYRKYKASQRLKNEKFASLEKQLMCYKTEQIARDDDDSLCCICYENIKDVIFFPCKHMTCGKCYDAFKETNKCPTCRTKIIIQQ